MRRLLGLFLVGFSLCLSPSVALAQPKVPDEELKKQMEAQKRFEEAEKLYNIGDYEGALTGYKEAYLLSNNPDLLFNMGQCYRKLGKYDDALITYRSYLREVPNSPVKADVEARIAEVEKEKANPKFSKVVISSDPPGAEVHKGGSTSRVIGVTPFTIDQLIPGEHAFTLTLPGFEPFEINLVSEGGKDYVIPEARLQKEKKLKPDWSYRLAVSGEVMGSFPGQNGSFFGGGLPSIYLERFGKRQRLTYGLALAFGAGGQAQSAASIGFIASKISYWRPTKKPLWSLGFGGMFGALQVDQDLSQSGLFLSVQPQLFRAGEYRGGLFLKPFSIGITSEPRKSLEFGILGIGYIWGLRKKE
jgi:tetratricopeptide (TPR) repeat protein